MNDAAGTRALEALARELGVSASSLAQYVDGAGSYAKGQSHSTFHRRKLPPRGSIEGNLLAQRVRRETGAEKMRGLVRRPQEGTSP